MGGQQPRGSGGKPRRRKTTRQSALSQTNADAEVTAVRREIQRVLDTPLAELVDSEEERAGRPS